MKKVLLLIIAVLMFSCGEDSPTGSGDDRVINNYMDNNYPLRVYRMINDTSAHEFLHFEIINTAQRPVSSENWFLIDNYGKYWDFSKKFTLNHNNLRSINSERFPNAYKTNDVLYLFHANRLIQTIKFKDLIIGDTINIDLEKTTTIDTRKFNLPNKLELPYSKRDSVFAFHKQHIVSYNMKDEAPYWVAYELTANETKGNVNIPTKFTRDYYLNVAQDYIFEYIPEMAGQLMSPEICKYDSQVMESCFYLSNAIEVIEPTKDLLRYGFAEFEKNLANTYGNVWVVTAVSYFGDSSPKYIGKAYLISDIGTYKILCFKIEGYWWNLDLSLFVVSTAEFESTFGIDIFHNLNDNIEIPLEKTSHTDLLKYLK